MGNNDAFGLSPVEDELQFTMLRVKEAYRLKISVGPCSERDILISG